MSLINHQLKQIWLERNKEKIKTGAFPSLPLFQAQLHSFTPDFTSYFSGEKDEDGDVVSP